MVLNLTANVNMSELDLRLELAVALYVSNTISFGKARELAGLDWVRFRKVLADREIPVHYNADDLKADLAVLNEFPAQ